MTREEILDRAFTRAPFPHTRRLSAGILTLARQLGLQFAVNTSQRRELTDAEAELEGIARTWLLDEDVDLTAIRRAVTAGRDHVFTEILPDYAMNLHPLKLRNALREVELTNEEYTANEYSIEPKPNEKPGDTPSGKF